MSVLSRRTFLTAAPAAVAAATVATPVPAPQPSAPHPWDTPAWAAAARSPAMDDLRLLYGLLDTAEAVARAIAAAHPPGACRCAFCAYQETRWLPGELPFIARDIGRAASEVQGEINYPVRLDGGDFAGDLRTLADFADRIPR